MNKYLIITLKIVVAIILLQTLYFKFSGAQESIDLFTKIAGENEAVMRIGTGILELIASLLLFAPKKTWLGALLTLELMSGAVISHLTILAIVQNNDHLTLFATALIALIAAVFLLYASKKELPFLSKK
uniref:DoxX family membrane protein n=1 Tax=Polaribacter sp. TaxID=1920175 RepID=UPI004047FB08